MSTADAFDMSNFERNWSEPEIVPGDTVWTFGKVKQPGWDFVGIKNFGISYRIFTGHESHDEVRFAVRLLTS
jgi:hypothetical protein